MQMPNGFSSALASRSLALAVGGHFCAQIWRKFAKPMPKLGEICKSAKSATIQICGQSTFICLPRRIPTSNFQLANPKLRSSASAGYKQLETARNSKQLVSGPFYCPKARRVANLGPRAIVFRPRRSSAFGKGAPNLSRGSFLRRPTANCNGRPSVRPYYRLLHKSNQANGLFALRSGRSSSGALQCCIQSAS